MYFTILFYKYFYPKRVHFPPGFANVCLFFSGYQVTGFQNIIHPDSDKSLQKIYTNMRVENLRKKPETKIQYTEDFYLPL